MSKLITWLSGKKVYILTAASVVYAILAMTHHAPNPDQLAVWALQVALIAAAFRSTLAKLLAGLQK